MLPKIEAKYSMPVSNFSLGVYGGYNTYKDLAADENVDSMLAGLGFNGSFGAFWFNSAFTWAQNATNGGFGLSYANAAAAGGEDTTTMAVAVALGMAASEQMSFEGGVGYWADTNDDLGDETDTNMAIYVNMTYTIAPGFFVVPEVGYIDMMKDMNDNDEGNMTYAGAKWQMNF